MAGYSENVTVHEGVDPYGTALQLHFQGDQLITQKTYDAEPMLRQCAAERAATEGDRWGEMRKVGTMPMAEYAKAMAIRDNQERRKLIRSWLLSNPAFVSFDRYKR